MSMHGSGFAQLATVAITRLPPATAGANQVPTWRGFRHFPREPRADERCALRFDPGRPEDHARLRGLFSRLAVRMSAEQWQGSARDNPDIPSGYTYLLQLVAHDLVQSSMPASLLQDDSLGLTNLRDATLQLDTIYGGGPDVTPAAYAIDGPPDQSRRKLRLGRMGADPAKPGAACPFRDIARAAAADTDGPTAARLTEPLVADPRNDDHAILAQLTALFHHLHNRIVDLLPAPDATPRGSSPTPAAQHAACLSFLCAREATALIYRRVVRRDLLPRILHPAVLEHYEHALPEGLVADHDGVPLEFSHGAFRFGHAMIRNGYVINDASGEQDLAETLTRSSSRAPGSMPLNPTWIAQWSRFFPVNGNTPNLSQRIGPQFSDGLSSDELFPAIDETGRTSLAYRDLVSAATVGLWSVGALMHEIKTRWPEMAELSPLVDGQVRGEAIRAWLSTRRDFGPLSDDDIAAISADPPLPFFVLFEAATTQDGRTLGVLGSIIVADVIYGGLGTAPSRRERSAESLESALGELSAALYGDRTELQAVPEIASMADIVTFVANGPELQAAMPPAFV